MPYKLKHLDPKKTAVLVIDMQNDFIEEGAAMYTPMGHAFVKPLAKFLDSCRALGMPVIYTSHAYRKDKSDMGKGALFCDPAFHGEVMVENTHGVEIYPAIAPKPGDVVITKRSYSGFFATEMDMVLKHKGIDTVVITGVCTEACCFSTARDALFNGYDVAFLSDLTGTIDFPDLGQGAYTAQQIHQTMLCVIAMTTADVMTSDQLLELAKKEK